MTTTDVKVLHSRAAAQERAIQGMQAPLYVVEKPAGASSALLGASLKEATISVNGAYEILIPTGGLASTLTVKIKSQLGGTATLSSSGPDELTHDFDPRTVNVADGVVLTAGTGDGPLSDDTLQTATLTMTGALYARVTLTHGGSGSVTFDLAEVTGL